MKICRWCLKENPEFADSHIIPKSFFNHDGKNDRKIVPYKGFPKRRPVGSYDGNILCVDCEANFQDIDSQAANILLQNFEDKLIRFGDKKDEIAFQIDGKYKQPIKRFLIYTLWKASASSLEEFRNINLGAFENKIKQELIGGTIFENHEYSFSAFKVEKSSGNIYPRKLNKGNFSGLNYYELDFANFIFNIKIDSRVTPEPLNFIAEHEHVVFNKINKTPEKRRQAMVKIVKSQKYKGTKMRKIIPSAVLLFIGILPSYATDNSSNGKALLDYCNAAIQVQENWDAFQKKSGDDLWEPLVKARYCQGIVKGVLGTTYGFQAAGIADNSCMPKDLSVDQAIKDVVEYINNSHETAYEEKDVEVIQEALIFKYMCN